LEEKINLRIPLKNEEQLDREVEKFLVNIKQSAWGIPWKLREHKGTIILRRSETW